MTEPALKTDNWQTEVHIIRFLSKYLLYVIYCNKWQLLMATTIVPDVIGFFDNGCHQNTPSPSLPASSLNTAARSPQGHAIQSDWRRDEEPAELMYSTCLLFIMARRGFSGKLTSVPQTPSLVNEVTSH